MAVIHELNVAYGKSLRLTENVEELAIDDRGLIFGGSHMARVSDRQYMVVEDQAHVNMAYDRGHIALPGHFLSQREDPVLARIVPTPAPGGVHLSTEGHRSLFVPQVADVDDKRREVSVWSWNGEAVDQGDEAAAWLGDIIGRKVRFVARSDEKPRYVEGNRDLGQVGFADKYPLTVATTVGLERLSRQYEKQTGAPITSNRLRPTMILDQVEVPFELPEWALPEDFISAITIVYGALSRVLRQRSACVRCSIPETDPFTGVLDKGPTVRAALKQIGRHGRKIGKTEAGVFFSQQYIIEPRQVPSDVMVKLIRGAEVIVEFSDTTNWAPIPNPRSK